MVTVLYSDASVSLILSWQVFELLPDAVGVWFIIVLRLDDNEFWKDNLGQTADWKKQTQRRWRCKRSDWGMMCCYSKAFSLTLFHSSTLLSGVSNNKTPVRSLALRHQYLDDERKIIIFFRNIPPLVTEFKAMEWEILGTNSMFTAPTVCDSESAYTWRSVGSSWRRAPSGTFRFRLKSRQLRLCRGASSLSRGRVCHVMCHSPCMC